MIEFDTEKMNLITENITLEKEVEELKARCEKLQNANDKLSALVDMCYAMGAINDDDFND